MPFKSEKQRKWMHANEPEMAKEWEKKKKMKKETKVRELIRKMVREIMAEGPIHHTDAKFVRIPKNDVRKAQQILKKFKNNVEIEPKAIKNMVRITTTKKMYNKVLDALLSKGITKIKERKLSEAKETIFDVAARVMKDKQAYGYKTKKGLVTVDVQTANLLTKVFKKVNPKMKKILSDIGYKSPTQLMNTLWAVVK